MWRINIVIEPLYELNGHSSEINDIFSSELFKNQIITSSSD